MLIAIMVTMLLLIVPLPVISQFFTTMILSNPLTGLVAFLLICGGALLPDMDNLKSDGGSAATWDLGVLGSIISTIMVTISSVVTSIFHGKRDVNPETQHRFFWHTLFVPLVLLVVTYFTMPDTQTPVIEHFTNFNLQAFPSYMLIVLLGMAICVYVGAHLLLKKLAKIMPIDIRPGMVSLALSGIAIAVGIALSTEHDLKMYAYCISIGYLLHLLGDMFADGGIPALFPVSGIFGKFFMRVKLLPVTVTTGSTIESLLKIVFLVIDIVLAIIVFFPGLVSLDAILGV